MKGDTVWIIMPKNQAFQIYAFVDRDVAASAWASIDGGDPSMYYPRMVVVQ